MKRSSIKIDLPLFIAFTVMAIFGMFMIFSASSVSTILRYNKDTSFFFLRQLMFVVGGYIVGFVILKIPTKTYNKLIIPALVGITALLAGLFMLDTDINSAKSWYDLGFFSLQPSEFAKVVIIIFMGVFYNTLHVKKVKNIGPYLIPLVIAGILIILIGMQPDFGSALILAGITGMIFISLPAINQKGSIYLKVALGAGVVLLGSFYLFGDEILSSSQISRLQNYQNPCSRYTEESGYQVCNGYIAINNGGLFGVGLGESTQKFLYLPESHTDFIFPIIVEELGLIVGIVIILVYLFILYRITAIARNAHNLKCSIIAYGAFAMLSMHLLINLLGVLAVIPLTGVPLPLLSYGGSSTICFIIMFFVVQRIAIESKDVKFKRELKKLKY